MNNKMNATELEDQEIAQQEQYLTYVSNVIPIETITVPIDEPIKHSSYYRYVAKAIEDLTENDCVRFNISSPGGHLSGLETLLSALKRTPATSVACINSDCHSAASILALNCDMVEVSPYAQMLVHYLTFGVGGPSNHVFKHSEHIKKVSERLFRETYYGFLTEEEITRCIEDDLQIWLDSYEIIDRLQIRQAILEEEQQDGSNYDKEFYGDTTEPLDN